MDTKGKVQILAGGMILITLGALIILEKIGIYGFSSSWPILLVVIAIGTLIQRVKDIGGWIIGIVGVLFFSKENLGLSMDSIATYLLPLLLILIGISFLSKFKKKQES